MSREDLVNEILKEDGLYDSAVAEWMRQDAITVTDDVYIFVNFNETVRREITEHAVGKRTQTEYGVSIPNLLRFIKQTKNDAALVHELVSTLKFIHILNSQETRSNPDTAWRNFQHLHRQGIPMTRVNLLLARLARLSSSE
jgi:hypothetical protein